MTSKVSADFHGLATAVDILKAELRADVAVSEARIYRSSVLLNVRFFSQY